MMCLRTLNGLLKKIQIGNEGNDQEKALSENTPTPKTETGKLGTYIPKPSEQIFPGQ